MSSISDWPTNMSHEEEHEVPTMEHNYMIVVILFQFYFCCKAVQTTDGRLRVKG